MLINEDSQANLEVGTTFKLIGKPEKNYPDYRFSYKITKIDKANDRVEYVVTENTLNEESVGHTNSRSYHRFWNSWNFTDFDIHYEGKFEKHRQRMIDA